MPSPYTLSATPTAYVLTLETATPKCGHLITATKAVYVLTMVGTGGDPEAAGTAGIVASAASYAFTGAAARPRAGFTSYRNIYFPPKRRR